VVSDPAYVQDYGLEDRDRLVSFAAVTRTRRNEYVSVRTRAFQSIRAGDVNSQLPNLVTDATLHRRFNATPLGGAGGLKLQVHAHRRASSANIVGRDMARATVEADWRRNWTFDNGLLAGVMTQVAADYYAIRQDSTYPGGTGRLTPTLAAELRWPLLRTDPDGVAHVIEPMVQVAQGPRSLRRVPNEDSVLVEFDEGNLFALNRFPGTDRREIGLRANVGVSYTRHDPAGWSMGATVGRVFRRADVNAFTDGTGLDGSRSDWLAAVHLNMGEGIRLANRTLIDDRWQCNPERDADRLGRRPLRCRDRLHLAGPRQRPGREPQLRHLGMGVRCQLPADRQLDRARRGPVRFQCRPGDIGRPGTEL
jgi:LPS-assembly protein